MYRNNNKSTGWVACNSQMRLSARRQTVRHTCACAEAVVPPGSIKLRRGGSVESRMSIRCSSRSTSSGYIRLASRKAVSLVSVARYEPMGKKPDVVCRATYVRRHAYLEAVKS